MAIVKTIIDGNTKIHILDDAYVNKTPEELEQQRQKLQDKINQLAYRIAMGEFDIDKEHNALRK